MVLVMDRRQNISNDTNKLLTNFMLSQKHHQRISLTTPILFSGVFLNGAKHKIKFILFYSIYFFPRKHSAMKRVEKNTGEFKRSE